MSQNPITRLLRVLFFAVVVRAVILVALGGAASPAAAL
jgi:hypothetical protein